MSPLEDRHVLSQIPLAHPPERPQEVPHPGPQALHGVTVDLTHPVTIGVDRPRAFGPRVIHGLMDSVVPLSESVGAVPLLGRDRRTLPAGVVHDRRQRAPAGRVDDLQADLTRLPPDHAGDRRSVGVEGPVAPAAVGPPPRWVGRVVVG